MQEVDSYINRVGGCIYALTVKMEIGARINGLTVSPLKMNGLGAESWERS